MVSTSYPRGRWTPVCISQGCETAVQSLCASKNARGQFPHILSDRVMMASSRSPPCYVLYWYHASSCALRPDRGSLSPHGSTSREGETPLGIVLEVSLASLVSQLRWWAGERGRLGHVGHPVLQSMGRRGHHPSRLLVVVDDALQGNEAVTIPPRSSSVEDDLHPRFGQVGR